MSDEAEFDIDADVLLSMLRCKFNRLECCNRLSRVTGDGGLVLYCCVLGMFAQHCYNKHRVRCGEG